MNSTDLQFVENIDMLISECKKNTYGRMKERIYFIFNRIKYG